MTDWTALAISAFALAARVLEEPRYEEAARRAADRILDHCVRDGRLLHREKAGKADIPGFATDYAYLIEALLDLYEATFVPRYFTEAVRLQGIFDATFADPRGGYFLSAAEHDGLILRPKESWDAATPSSNSVAAMNLLRLSVFTGDARYRERSDAIFAAHADLLARAATAFPRLLCALDFQSDPPREIVLAGAPGREDFEGLRRAVFASPRLNRVVAHAESAAGIPELAAVAEGRGGSAAAAAYVCTGFACQAPVSDPEALRTALAIFAAHAGLLARAATAFPRLLCALDFQTDPPREIVLAGAPGEGGLRESAPRGLREPGLQPRGRARRIGGRHSGARRPRAGARRIGRGRRLRVHGLFLPGSRVGPGSAARGPRPAMTTGLVYDERFLAHRAPYDHPEHPGRLTAIWRRLEQEGLAARCRRVAAREASDGELERIHTAAHVAAVDATAREEFRQLDPDTYACRDSALAARLAAGGLVDLAAAVADGRLSNGLALLRPPGHHADADRAMGFCLFNNVAVAARGPRRPAAAARR